jgi:hypothetical protein
MNRNFCRKIVIFAKVKKKRKKYFKNKFNKLTKSWFLVYNKSWSDMFFVFVQNIVFVLHSKF